MTESDDPLVEQVTERTESLKEQVRPGQRSGRDVLVDVLNSQSASPVTFHSNGHYSDKVEFGYKGSTYQLEINPGPLKAALPGVVDLSSSIDQAWWYLAQYLETVFGMQSLGQAVVPDMLKGYEAGLMARAKKVFKLGSDAAKKAADRAEQVA